MPALDRCRFALPRAGLVLLALAPVTLALSAGCQWMSWPDTAQPGGIIGEEPDDASSDAAPASDELIERCSDRDPRARADALRALAKSGHERAAEHLRAALKDHELSVRLAAAAALGELGGAVAEAALAETLATGAEQVRAAAVDALADAGAEQAVLAAAEDKSWRVRRGVARALARFPTRNARRAAEELLEDTSVEVHWAVVGAVAGWPLELAGPVLLRAMAGEGYRSRSQAVELLAAQWPPAAEFPVDGPAPERNEALAKLEKRFWHEFQQVDPAALVRSSRAAANPAVATEQRDLVEALLDRHDVAGLAATGPDLLAALEVVVFDRKHLLPEWVYRDVLARQDATFEAIERLGSEGLPDRRRAAGRLVELSGERPLTRLAVARLHTLIVAEPDQLVWQSALKAVADDPGEQAAALACAAIGHPSPEVRRRACEHLAAHPAPGHAKVLLASLSEQSPSVLAAVVRALGELDRLDDTRPLRPLLMSEHETVSFEAARSLHRLGDASGTEALRRLAQSDDPTVRHGVARAIGERPDPTLLPVLVAMLDDDVSVRRAAVESLEAIAGGQSPASPDGPAAGTGEQVERWKRWARQQGIVTEPRRR